MYRIIFRTCDKINSLHSAPRPFGMSKRELIEACFRSVVASVREYPHSFHIIADNISDELRRFFQSYDVVMTEGTFGNDESIRVSLKQAMSYDDTDWVYICEDDYLHQHQTFLWIDDLIQNRKEILYTKSLRGVRRFIPFDHRRELHTMPLFIHPPDYPDRYKPRERRHSYLFLSQYCHWRQISNTTFTFLAEVKSLRQFASILEHSATGADDGYLSNKIYARDRFGGRALCLSPIPGLTTHLHEGVMTPLVDWENIVRKNQ
ncbi:MAG TPA: hypothetical protein VG537_11410 [Candidatus Kapabacteria bacterium]|jgi:hypothetical protein|nr:hypothetical protein [Candidatus Kapabacteria bacterium]